MSIDRGRAVSPDLVDDLKMAQTLREDLPILVLLFTPITVAYSSYFEPVFSVLFLLGTINFNHYFQVTIFDPSSVLFFSVPALMASIVSTWILRRLSQRKTSSRNALRVVGGVTLIWAVYLSVFFFGALSVGRLVVGPFPVPFGPIIAVLSRGYLIRLSEQIDELEKPDEGLANA